MKFLTFTKTHYAQLKPGEGKAFFMVDPAVTPGPLPMFTPKKFPPGVVVWARRQDIK